MRTRRLPGAGYGLLTAIVVIVTVDVLVTGPLTALDHTVHRFAERDVHGRVLWVVHGVHLLGQRWALLIVIVPLVVIASLRTRSVRYLLMTVVIMGGLAILQAPLKAAIPRTYPISGVDEIFVRGDAYPSGHTLNGFVLVWVALELLVVAFPALSIRLTSERRWAVAGVTGLLTGLAVTLADYHWLTDALASFGLGPILLALLVTADPFRTRHAEQAQARLGDRRAQTP